jgi:hypothetical protein
MRRYVLAHEKFLSDNNYDSQLLEYHMMQISFVQHERLIHLLVLMLTSILFIMSIIIFYITVDLLIGLIVVVLFILELFYIRHYFFLENHVQKWYEYANNMYKAKSLLWNRDFFTTYNFHLRRLPYLQTVFRNLYNLSFLS